MVKKSSASSRQEKQQRENKTNITGKLLTELKKLQTMTDEDIDTSDIPEILDWSKAEAGKFYRPVKTLVSLRVDADVLHWFKARAKHYTPMMNQALRAYIAMAEAASKSQKSPHK